MRLTEFLDTLKNDQALTKLASQGRTKIADGDEGYETVQTSQSMTTEEPQDAMLGGTAEDKQNAIRDKLMSMAGTQDDSVSSAGMEEELNTDNKPKQTATELIPPAAPPKPDSAAAMAAMSGLEGGYEKGEKMAQFIDEAVRSAPESDQVLMASQIIEKLSSHLYSDEDIEKVSAEEAELLEKAAEEEIIKVAEEWDALGRIAARGFLDEISNQAPAE